MIKKPLPVSCPLAPCVDDFVRQSQSLSASVRTLRREFSNCRRCDQYDTCDLRESFKGRVLAAVSDLTDEWNLSESF